MNILSGVNSLIHKSGVVVASFQRIHEIFHIHATYIRTCLSVIVETDSLLSSSVVLTFNVQLKCPHTLNTPSMLQSSLSILKHLSIHLFFTSFFPLISFYLTELLISLKSSSSPCLFSVCLALKRSNTHSHPELHHRLNTSAYPARFVCVRLVCQALLCNRKGCFENQKLKEGGIRMEIHGCDLLFLAA